MMGAIKVVLRPLSAVSRVCSTVGVVVLGAVVLAGVVAVPVLAAGGDANEAACPNEGSSGFRQYLPDCRAYELVTPPFKNGQLVQRIRVAPGGSRVAFSSVGAFDEAAGNDLESGAAYIASRSGGGWSSSSVTPSAQQFGNGTGFRAGVPSEQGNTTDFAEDLGASLFAQAPLAGKPVDYRFYRQQLGGPLTEIGPLSPPGRVAAFTQADAEAKRFPATVYAGATGTLSHVLYIQKPFSTAEGVEAWYWPGDPTKSYPSLYEYSGVDRSEPEIVGVMPGAGEAKKLPSEAPAVASECGTILGGGATHEIQPEDAMNAISRVPSSEEGSHIVFTALGLSLDQACEAAGVTSAPPVNEVFTRIGGVRSVAVSEPSVADCAACDESHPATAVFQGASADGDKIFFISEQRYFDGAGGEVEGVPNLYEFDLAAGDPHEKLTLIAPGLVSTVGHRLAGVVRVTDDGRRVYFVSSVSSLAGDLDAKQQPAEPGADNLYVADTATHTTSFVGTLVSADEGLWKSPDTRPAESTPDGRYLVFASSADLTPDAAGPGQQIYRYDAEAGSLVRVSVGAQGFNGNGDLGQASKIAEPGWESGDGGGPQLSSISSDGEEIFFESSGALTPQALNEVCAYEEAGVCEEYAQNVYEWRGGSVYLISDGQDSASAFRGSATQLVGTSGSGEEVFFTSASRLVGEDTDTQQDLYVARVDGGAPAGSVAQSECAGECQGAGAPAPVFSTPASSFVNGPGDSVPVSPVAKPKVAVVSKTARLLAVLRKCRRVRAERVRKRCETRARGGVRRGVKGRGSSRRIAVSGGTAKQRSRR